MNDDVCMYKCFVRLFYCSVLILSVGADGVSTMKEYHTPSRIHVCRTMLRLKEERRFKQRRE